MVRFVQAFGNSVVPFGVDLYRAVCLPNLALFFNRCDLQGIEVVFRELTDIPLHLSCEDVMQGSVLQQELSR
jgi:hypothetical protein